MPFLVEKDPILREETTTKNTRWHLTVLERVFTGNQIESHYNPPQNLANHFFAPALLLRCRYVVASKKRTYKKTQITTFHGSGVTYAKILILFCSKNWTFLWFKVFHCHEINILIRIMRGGTLILFYKQRSKKTTSW